MNVIQVSSKILMRKRHKGTNISRCCEKIFSTTIVNEKLELGGIFSISIDEGDKGK